MIVVMNHIGVKDEYRKAFEDTFINRAHLVEKMAGFIKNEVLRPIRGDKYIVLTYWDSIENFNMWAESAEFRSAHRQSTLPREAITDNHVTVHEVFSTT
jgi:heme-degrading monooxygenase HmoA